MAAHRTTDYQEGLYFMNSNFASSQSATCRQQIFLFLALSCVLTACQKAETVPTTADRLKYVEQKQQTEPDYYVPRKVVDYMSDMKTIKDNTPKPATPAVAVSAPITTKPADVRTAVAVAETKPAASAVAAPVPTPVQAAPVVTAPAANVVASAVPTARPVPAGEVASAVTVISREQPDFPRDAIRAGVESGSVRARLIINATGSVSSVVIVEAKPMRVFDRSVTQALLRWKFNPGADGRTYETEINFKL